MPGSQLTQQQTEALYNALRDRFNKNMSRHKGIKWDEVQQCLDSDRVKTWSVHEMERTGGEPDVVSFDPKKGQLLFMDCSAESPSGRRSLCFDEEALAARKENKPAGSAMELARKMGIALLSETQYRQLQELGSFDLKTSSWIQTPESIRKLGGALFCDRRYDHVFLYHNGVQSYYAARGFRGYIYV